MGELVDALSVATGNLVGGSVAAALVAAGAPPTIAAAAGAGMQRYFEQRVRPMLEERGRQNEEYAKLGAGEFRDDAASVAKVIAALDSDDREVRTNDVENLVQQTLRELSDSISDTRRAAIVSAFRAQFDPALGDAATRRFWWKKVVELEEQAVLAIAYIKGGTLFQHPDEESDSDLFWIPDRQSHEIERISVSGPMRAMLHRYIGRQGYNDTWILTDYVARVSPRLAILSDRQCAGWELTSDGHVLWSFIGDLGVELDQ